MFCRRAGGTIEVKTTAQQDGQNRRNTMSKAVISLATGLEDPEKVTVAFLVAVGAAEQGRSTLMFLTKEAVRLATQGVAIGVACHGCPPLPELTHRYQDAGGRYLVCPLCFNAKGLAETNLVANASLGGTVPMWQWIGDDPATTFSYSEETTMETTVGAQFASALATKDHARMLELFTDPVDFQALTPGRHWQASTPTEAVEDIILGVWFGPRDDIHELRAVSCGQVADRERVTYRLGVHRDGKDYVVEQQAYYHSDGAHITWIRILCSGYRREATN